MSGPQSYSYRPLPNSREESRAVRKEMLEILRNGGATFFRFTVVNDEYPNNPYPHGLYLEGWDVPPQEQGKFNFPMKIVPCAPTQGGIIPLSKHLGHLGRKRRTN